ncbi:MAG: hypothetical protein ACOC8F_05655 [Planctomycetota bacterium]
MPERSPLTVLVLLLAAAACPADSGDGPPTNLPEYRSMRRQRPAPWPDYTVRQYNLRRVWNDDLPAAQRVASLDLVVHLSGDDETVARQLSLLLGRRSTPRRLYEAVLTHLLRKGTHVVAEHVVKALENPDLPADLRDAILRWLVDHPQPEVLARVVQLWADEPPDGPNEPRFVRIVERIARTRWDRALLDGINAERFDARGSAMEVLSARIDKSVLRRRILQREPATPAMAALHVFVERFDWLPPDGRAFLAATWLYTHRADRIEDAAALARRWRRAYGYRFGVRDFHLLAHLGADPQHQQVRRSQLVMQVGQMLVSREHLPPSAYADRPAAAHRQSIPDQLDRLSMPELWTVKLIGEMFVQRRVQRALQVVAGQDRADRRSVKGGLIVYENGRAEAKLYPADVQREQDDLHYVPSRYAVKQARDALAWFTGHFDRVENIERVGPDAVELRAAAEGRFRAVVLTSLSARRFTAHYYNPDGRVVSLGVYPFGQ